MLTLGLDPSLTGFGWCVHNSAVLGRERVLASGRFPNQRKTIFVKRYTDLRESVCQLLDRYVLIEAVGIESPTYGEQWSPGAYGLFLMVNEAVWSRRRDVVFFDPGTVKMLARGAPNLPGKMFKSDMVEACKAETGLTLNHNEADAYHVAKSAARFWMLLRGEIGPEDLTPAEVQAFTRIHTFSKGKRVGQTVRLGAMFKENQRFFRFSRWEASS